MAQEEVYERIRTFKVNAWYAERMAGHAQELAKRIDAWHSRPPPAFDEQDIRHINSGFRRLSSLLSMKENGLDRMVYVYSRVDHEQWAEMITEALWESMQFARLKSRLLTSDTVTHSTHQMYKRFVERYEWPPQPKSVRTRAGKATAKDAVALALRVAPGVYI